MASPPLASPRRPAPRPLWTFHGGLHLPDEKALSSGAPLATAPLPPLLVIPLQQHIGAPAKPLVGVGDLVGKGQLIGEAQGALSATVHAPSSGTVVAIEERPVPHASGLSAPCILIATDGRPGPISPRPWDPDPIRRPFGSASAGRASSAWVAPPSPAASSLAYVPASASAP